LTRGLLRLSSDGSEWDLDDLPLGTRDPADRIIPFSQIVGPAQPEPKSEPPSVTRAYEYLSEGIDSELGSMLADGLMVPEGVTVLYGPGGVGKGHVACEAIRHLVLDGPVLIVDYEAHRSEWRKRLRLMLSVEQLERVAYVVPEAQLPKSAVALRDMVREIGALSMVVDSYQAGTPDGRVHAEQADTPRDMFRALAVVGVPTLMLAHVTKSGGDHQPHPYGSVFVHSYARMTWSIARLSDDGDPLTVELRNQKANDRPRDLPRRYTFTYTERRLVVDREVLMSRGDLIASVLRGQKAWLMPAAIYTLMVQLGVLPDDMTVQHIGSLLRNDKGDRFERSAEGWKVKVGRHA